MTDNPVNTDDADTGSALITVDAPDEHADLPEELALTDLPEELAEIDDDDDIDDDIDDQAADSGEPDVPGSGAVSGGFGLAGLALAVVSLTTNWTSNVVVSHGQYREEVNAPSSGLSVQQELNMYANAWHTEGYWALGFAVAAVLFGSGALLAPRLLRSRRIPGWAKATATGAIIVGLVGVLLAVLTIVGVFGGHLTAPATAS